MRALKSTLPLISKQPIIGNRRSERRLCSQARYEELIHVKGYKNNKENFAPNCVQPCVNGRGRLNTHHQKIEDLAILHVYTDLLFDFGEIW